MSWFAPRTKRVDRAAINDYLARRPFFFNPQIKESRECEKRPRREKVRRPNRLFHSTALLFFPTTDFISQRCSISQFDKQKLHLVLIEGGMPTSDRVECHSLDLSGHVAGSSHPLPRCHFSRALQLDSKCFRRRVARIEWRLGQFGLAARCHLGHGGAQCGAATVSETAPITPRT